MKSYNHLWEQTVAPENIKTAIRNASKGKRKREYVKRVFEHQDEYVPYYQQLAVEYRHRKKPPKVIYDGISRKKREIIVPSFDEQVLHHMVVNALAPIIQKGKYQHAHGSVPKTGPAKGKKTIQSWIGHQTKNVKYFLKMDIRQFFGSVPHDRLEALAARKIHDKKFLRLLHEIISCTDKGLPLGFHTSHWLANWYLQDLDHFIKEKLKAVHYIRYMDDMVIFGPNKRDLHRMRAEIEAYLNRELGLELKGNWAVARFNYKDRRTGGERGRDLDFMGFRFYRKRITMRRSIMLRMTRKARAMGKKEKPTVYDCRQMISALGWLKQTDTYGMYLIWIKPSVNFRNCKKRISRYDKRQSRKEKESWIGEKQKTATARNLPRSTEPRPAISST